MAENERLICKRDALVDGGRAVKFSAERDGRVLPCFIVAYDGGVHAFVNYCPHRGTELDWQPGEVFEESGLYLICATHGALFEPEGGLCVGGPCHGARLTSVPVLIDNEWILLGGGYRLVHVEQASIGPSSSS